MGRGGPEVGPNRRSKEQAAQVGAPEAAVQEDPVEDARGELFDIVRDSNTTIVDALGKFAVVTKAKKEVGVSGLNLLAGLRDDATVASLTSADKSVAAAFSAISSAFSEGINAAIDEMGRRVDTPSVKRNIALEGPVARTDQTPAQRRRAEGRVINRPER